MKMFHKAAACHGFMFKYYLPRYKLIINKI